MENGTISWKMGQVLGKWVLVRESLRGKNQKWAFVTWLRCRAETERHRETEGGYGILSTLMITLMSRWREEKNISKQRNIDGCPQECEVGRNGPREDSTSGSAFAQTAPPWIFSVHCCKNNLPRRGDVPSSVKCAFSDLSPNLTTRIKVSKAPKIIGFTAVFRFYSVTGVKACCLGWSICSWDGPSHSWQMGIGTLVSQRAALAPFSPSECCMFVTSPHSELFKTLHARTQTGERAEGKDQNPFCKKKKKKKTFPGHDIRRCHGYVSPHSQA